METIGDGALAINLYGSLAFPDNLSASPQTSDRVEWLPVPKKGYKEG